MVAVSVIIPVFNADKHLHQCVNSLLQQSLKNCEFIFINDGSTDTSQAIIESYQKKDSRIILLNQENQGVSVARNNGIVIAKAEFIGFVDADDTIENDFFEKLYTSANQNNATIVTSCYIHEINGVSYKTNPIFSENIVFDNAFIDKNIIPILISESSLNTVWNKIYETNFIKNNNIKFPKGVALGEDNIFNLQAFYLAQNIVFTDYAGYHYKETIGSATRTIATKDYFNRALEVYSFNYEKLLNTKIENLEKLKSIRLFNNTLSYIDLYLKNNNGFPFLNRYSYVKKMINHPLIQSILKKYESDILKNKNSYQKFIILRCIKNKLMLPLIAANQYIQFRNK